jgi:hypothetical protein
MVFSRANAKEADAVIGAAMLSILRRIRLSELAEAMLLAVTSGFRRASAAATAEEAAADVASNLRRESAAVTAEEADAVAARPARSLTDAEAAAAEEIVACIVMRMAAKATRLPFPVGGVLGSLYLVPNPGFHG